MFVRQDRNCPFFTGRFKAIALRQGSLRPGIFNLRAIFILWQVLYLCFPAVLLVQRHFCPVAQLYFQFFRPLAVLVIGIIPYLPDCCRCRFRRMAVSQGCDRSFFSGACQGIPFRQSFLCPSICNLHAVRIFWQVLHLYFPMILFVQRHFCPVAQLYFQFFWPLAVLVTGIIPYFFDCCRCHLWRVAVRNSRNRSIHACAFKRISCGKCSLRPGIFYLHAIFVLWQVLYLCFPAVRFAQRHFCPVAQRHCQL